MARTKTTGLAAFTNRGSALAAPDEARPQSLLRPAVLPRTHRPRQDVQEGRWPQQAAREGRGLPWRQRAPGVRRLGERLHQLAVAEGVSLQEINRARAVAGVHIQRPARHRRMTY